jgi:hypothetical protein
MSLFLVAQGEDPRDYQLDPAAVKLYDLPPSPPPSLTPEKKKKQLWTHGPRKKSEATSKQPVNGHWKNGDQKRANKQMRSESNNQAKMKRLLPSEPSGEEGADDGMNFGSALFSPNSAVQASESVSEQEVVEGMDFGSTLLNVNRR